MIPSAIRSRNASNAHIYLSHLMGHISHPVKVYRSDYLVKVS
jgi:hypothetical protein